MHEKNVRISVHVVQNNVFYLCVFNEEKFPVYLDGFSLLYEARARKNRK